MATILSAEPPLVSASRDGVPPGLDRVVKRCLAKDPDARWQNAGDLAAELQWVGEQAEAVSTPTARRHNSTRAWAMVTLLAAIAAGAAAWVLKPATPGPATATAQLTIDIPPGAVLENFAAPFAVSANGTLAYVSGGLETSEVVWVDRQGRAKPPIAHERRLFSLPRLSPDGCRLAVTVGSGNDATLCMTSPKGEG